MTASNFTMSPHNMTSVIFTVFFVDGDEGLEGGLGAGKAVLAFRTERDASFSFHECGGNLSYDRLDTVRAAPAL